MTYTVAWCRYPHGIKGEAVSVKTREFSDLEKAINFLLGRLEKIKSVNWAGGYIDSDESDELDMIYSITEEGTIYDDRAKLA